MIDDVDDRDLERYGYALANPSASLLELDRLDAEERLADFVKLAWPLIVGDNLSWGWSFDAICEVLEEVTAGRLKRVIINVPPGWSKSLLTNVFWPTWEWGPRGMGNISHSISSSSLELAKGNNRDCRELIRHPVYRSLWGGRVAMSVDQSAKNRFILKTGGFSQVIALDRPVGWRSHRMKIDDPNVIDEGDADKRRVRRRITRSFPSRLKDQKRDALILTQQRTDKVDATSVAIKAWEDFGVEFEHVCLPMRYKMVAGTYKEPKYPCKRDKRNEVGELLEPTRVDDAADRAMRTSMRLEGGMSAEAAQLDQDPMSESSGSFSREWLTGKTGERLLEAPLGGGTVIRAWDLAATDEPDSAWTVGLKMRKVAHRIGTDDTGGTSYRWYIEDVVRFRGSPGKVRQRIEQVAKLDSMVDPDIEISIPVDPGQAGIAQRDDYAGMLGPYRVHFSPEGRKSKPERCAPFLAHCETGSVFAVAGSWLEMFLSEGESLWGGFVDQFDAAGRAFNRLNADPVDDRDGSPIVVP